MQIPYEVKSISLSKNEQKEVTSLAPLNRSLIFLVTGRLPVACS